MKIIKYILFTIFLLGVVLLFTNPKLGTNYLLSINQLSFHNNEVTFGDSSDVIMPSLVKNGVVLTKLEKGWQIKLRNPVYYKINNSTRNAIDLDNINELKVGEVHINKKEFKSNIDDIGTNWKFNIMKGKFDIDQNYIPLKSFLHKINNRIDTNQIQSIYSREFDKMILLDEKISIVQKNGIVKNYKLVDTIQEESFKIEFFGTQEYSNYYATLKEKKKKFFYLDSLSYHVNVKSKYTTFGNSEFYVSTSDNHEIVTKFNKPYVYIIPNENVEKKNRANTQNPPSVVQNFTEFNENNIVVPRFSYTCPTLVFDISSKFQKISSTNIKLTQFSSYNIILIFIPLLFVFLLCQFYLFSTNYVKAIKDNLHFCGNNSEREVWISAWKTINYFLFALLIFRLLISYNLFITAPNYTYFLPMQIIIAPTLFLFVNLLWIYFAKKLSLKESISEKEKSSIICHYSKYLIVVFGIIVITIGLIYTLFKFQPFYLDTLLNQLFFDRIRIGKIDFNILNVIKKITISKLNPLYLLLLFIIGFVSFRNLFKKSWLLILFLFIGILILNNIYSALLLIMLIIMLAEYSNYKKTVLGIINSICNNKLVLLCLLFFPILWLFSNLLLTVLLFTFILLLLKFAGVVKFRLAKILDLLKIKDYASGIRVYITDLFQNSLIRYFLVLIATLILVSAFVKGDAGYIINILPISLAVFWILSVCTLTIKNKNIEFDENKKAVNRARFGFAILFLIFTAFAYTISSTSTSIDGRTQARLTALYRFDKMEEQGLKKTEGISQFFVVLGKYVMPNSSVKNESAFHPIISSNHDPVVINDLSFPVCISMLFGKYSYLIYVALILFWSLLFYQINKVSLFPKDNYNSEIGEKTNYRLHTFALIKIVALFYMIFSGLWLILSYFGVMPFTGRLLFGLGQDSSAEVIETIILFTCFGLIYYTKKMNIVNE